MATSNQASRGGCEGCASRRQFLVGCALGAGALVVGRGCQNSRVIDAGPVGAAPGGAGGLSYTALAPRVKTRVRLVFAHVPPTQATWPNIGYDYESRKKELLARLQQSCPHVEFVPVTAQNANEAKAILAQDAAATQPAAQPAADFDGYLVYLLGIWTGVSGVIAASGCPTIMVDDLYAGSGEFLIAHAAAKRAKQKVIGVSSSSMDDVAQAVRAMETVRVLKDSTILCVGRNVSTQEARAYADVFGPKVLPISFDELNEAYKKVGPADAAKWADRWIREADKVVEPSRQTLDQSGAMYLAMCDLMRRHQAQAITINCLGGFYGGKITAYPCLGFFQLNNDGLVGACESDMRSTLTMLLMAYLTGRPGYLSDPVIDTAKNQIIYAHCVSTNKVFGVQGKANAYHIRSHSEDRKGASVRSLMPLNQITTTVEFDPGKKQVVMHQARTVANIDEDKACRTKLAAEVIGDMDKLLAEWDRWGWHRVTFYGDLKTPVEQISTLLGLEVVREA